MRFAAKLALSAALFGSCPTSGWSQERSLPPTGSAVTVEQATKDQPKTAGRSLNKSDRLSLVSLALYSRRRWDAESDCSHLVHAIYQEAGFPYSYAPSSDLYAGVEGFQRVKAPKTGDLVVWRGHVGIVTKPSQHLFFSYMSAGPGIDDYEARYWKRRGRPRFYRYVRN